jgi:predicted nucleic acid-binding protein
VTVFLDTSVLIAAVRVADARHTASFDLVKRCSSGNASCAAHSMAEVYASLTEMRPPNRFRVAEAIQLLEQFGNKFRWVELSAGEILEAARGIAALGLLGGMIYDALLLKCARKVKAERIYTWNVRHFQMVAPDLAERMMTP